MDEDFLRVTIINRMRQQKEKLDEAANQVARGMKLGYDVVAPVVEAIQREGAKHKILDSPSGVTSETEEEAKLSSWYIGPQPGDEIWPRLRGKFESGSMASVIEDIDNASNKVVAHLADPCIHGLKKRGLVVGYVQSGKTANYTSVMAKAADAGYGLFIVLAGMFDNLREQTQVRLDDDIVDRDWVPLTSDEADFGRVIKGSAFLAKGAKSIAVVKKNHARLQSLLNWLKDVPDDILRKVPVLLLDDESDQATPNSATGNARQTRINQLVREIWAEIETGTYVGYTATPFANIFMDPNDDDELYPADFIIDLPRPDAYFGAERIFGREPLDEDDDTDFGLDMVRDIPDDDAAILRPPSKAELRDDFDPELPESLIDALTWFLVATAIRRARGQSDAHSSMLVHTTHYTQPHFAIQERIEETIDALRKSWHGGEEGSFLSSFTEESARAAEVASMPLPTWEEVKAELGRVLESVKVVVDNGLSEDRLDYRREVDGVRQAETVVAIGGGTLSRGLTLEGLVVSYFTRTSNTYDTLLQMGRWFGYRPGYEDLPRIWVQPALAEDFRFLALVEEEIRQEMRHMEGMRVTPKEMGLRVRAHPGRLSIVARNKMKHADIVRVSYAGQRMQTFIFNEKDGNVIQSNYDAVSNFIARCGKVVAAKQVGKASRWYFQDVPAQEIIGLIQSYTFHDDQVSLRPDHMIGWLERVAKDHLWNVVVMGSDKKHKTPDGEAVDLGTVDLGLPSTIPTVNRAPLQSPHDGTANIKALMSQKDWFLDLVAQGVELPKEISDKRAVRKELAGGRGLLVIYPVSRHSVPLRLHQGISSRRPLEAPDHLMGLGLIFPEVETGGREDDGTYYSTHPDWEVEVHEDEDEPLDREGELTVDGEKAAPR